MINDVPDVLRTVFGFDQQDLGLKVEELVIDQLRALKAGGDATLADVAIKNGDEGGGGRDGVHTGTIIYVALKLSKYEPPLDAVAEEDADEEDADEEDG